MGLNDDLDALLEGDDEAIDAMMNPVLLPGELQGTDEEVMAYVHEVPGDDGWEDDGGLDDMQFEGDPLLLGADGKRLSDDQLKLLYMISRYSHKARTPEETERWVRKIQLLVLIFEGIKAKSFNYDYAPQIEMIETKHIYMNISQEGKDDIDDLREAYMLAGAKVTSKDGMAITCYQLTEKGYDVLGRVPEDLCREVDDFIIQSGTNKVIEAVWDNAQEVFVLRATGMKKSSGRPSAVTTVEDVSYVSSPYVPDCLRLRAEFTLKNYAHRAAEARTGGTNIIDAELDENLFLDDIRIMVGEWIPYGMNQLLMLNQKLGSTERVRGGLFTSEVDPDSTNTALDTGTGMTSVSVLDYDEPAFVTIEAEVMLPEEEDIVQIECFGIHIRMDGTLVYGLQVEAVGNKIKNDISMDTLARVVVDIQQDSSEIVDSLLSRYQKALLDMVFLGDYTNRMKINIILTENMRPWLPAERYMDKESMENEIKQLLQDTDSAHQLDRNQVLIIGNMGILIAGLGVAQHEEMLVAYLSLATRDSYLRNFFARCIIFEDHMRQVRLSVAEHDRDPGSVGRIREKIATMSKDAILLDETLLYMQESMTDMQEFEEPPQEDEAAYNLHYLLNIGGTLHDMRMRSKDIEKNVEGIHHELQSLRDLTDVISEAQYFRMQEALTANTQGLEAVFRANEKTSANLEYMQVILAGSLAFAVLDRATGPNWSVVMTEWGTTYIREIFFDTEFLWFGVSMGFWLVLGWMLMKFMAHLKAQSLGWLTIKIKIDMPFEEAAYREFLSDRDIEDEDVDLCPNDTPGQAADVDNCRIKKIKWVENWEWGVWCGKAPTVEILVDEEHHFIIKVNIHYDKKKGSLEGMEVWDAMLELWREKGIVPKVHVPKKPKPFVRGEVIFEETQEEEMDVEAPIERLKFLDADRKALAEKYKVESREGSTDSNKIHPEPFAEVELDETMVIKEDSAYTRTATPADQT